MWKVLIAFAVGVLASLSVSPEGEAAAPEVVSADITPFVANVGDRMILTIVVEHQPGIVITGPGVDGKIGAFEILAVADRVTDATAVGEWTTLVYTLTSFRIGPGTIPPIELFWLGGGGSGVLRTKEVLYAVDSVLQPGDDSLRPLKAQLAIPQPAPPPFVPATILAMMAVLTGFGFWLIKLTIAVRPEMPAPVYIPQRVSPALLAKEELDSISRDGLASTDTAVYYERIAGAVRKYLTGRFGFPAFALTRREMAGEMERAGIDRWPARLTENLLEQSDAAEFARFEPAMERREQDLAAAYEIIELTSDEEVRSL